MLKKSLTLAVLLAVMVTVVGCKPAVSGRFFDRDRSILSEGQVTNGAQIMAPGGAELTVYFAKEKDFQILSVDKAGSEMKALGNAYATAAMMAAGALSAVVSFFGFGELSDNLKFTRTIPPLSHDLIIRVSNDLQFLLFQGGSEGEGEGEGQVEGEGEDQYSPTISNVSPTGSSITVTSGDSITVSARINGQHQCRVVLISPEGKEADELLSPPEYFSKTFPLTSVGYGDVSLRVTDQENGLFVERKWNVTILSAGEGQIEGEGESTANVPNLSGMTRDQAIGVIGLTCLVVGNITEVNSNTVSAGKVIDYNPKGVQSCGTAVNLVVSKGPAETEPLSVAINSPKDGEVFTLTGDPPHVHIDLKSHIGGSPSIGPVDVVIVTSEGKSSVDEALKALREPEKGVEKVLRLTITPPYDLSIPLELTLRGNGGISVRATPQNGGISVEKMSSIVLQ